MLMVRHRSSQCAYRCLLQIIQNSFHKPFEDGRFSFCKEPLIRGISFQQISEVDEFLEHWR
jgi:hypothetical protein